MLPDQINNAPASVALLDMGERERGHPRSPEPAAEKDS
jgi:hypothetical protein